MKKKQGGGTGGDSLSDLDPSGLPDTDLDLPDVDLSFSQEKAEKLVFETRAAAERIYNWIRAHLSQLDLIREAPREFQEAQKENVEKVRDTIEQYLSHKTEAFRRAAWLALLDHSFGKKLRDSDEADEIVEDLIQKGYLEQDDEGPLDIFGRPFSVPSSSYFGKEEIDHLLSAVSDFRFRASRLLRQQNRQKAEILAQRANISLQEMLEGKAGECFLQIPPERVARRGSEFWRGGGTFLIRQDEEGRIFPVDATGNIEETVLQAINMSIHLLSYTLAWDTPPFIKALPIENAKKVQLLWHLIKRAMLAEEEKEKMEAQKQVFSQQTTITQERFFLEGEEGVCLADFHGQWKNEGRKTPNIFFLIQREKTEERSMIQILEIPEHLEDFFKECRGAYTEGSEKFEGFPQPLQAVLQAIYGQTVKKAQIAGED